MFIFTRQEFEERVLPGPGGQGGEEGLHLDFKWAPDTGKSAHHATALDIAAFANSVGGALVFGVGEKHKFAHNINTELNIPATVKHVEDALTRWTYGFEERPRPDPLDVDGGRVVIVNVFPCARLVSVRGHTDQRSILYPFRHAHGNDFLKPEEVAHRLDTRRGFTARNQLRQWVRQPYPAGNGRPVDLFYFSNNKAHCRWNHTSNGPVTLEDVTPDGAKLLFRRPGALAAVAFVVPYEWVVSVWWNGDKVAMQVAACIIDSGGLITGFPIPW